MMTRYLLILFLLAGCKSPAPVEPITEQPRDARPVPTAQPQTYRYYTNAADDRLVERLTIPLLNVHTNTLTNIHWGTNIYIVLTNGMRLVNVPPDRGTVTVPYVFYTNAEDDRLIEDFYRTNGNAYFLTNVILTGPPVVPNYGPFPMQVVPRTLTSNWMTKAMAIEPKPMTNQIPGSTILTKITTTGSDGKPFTAELELHGNQTIQANDRMAVVIFSINTSNYVIETCENIAEGRWSPLTSGTGQDTNSALIVVDLYATNQPIKFYRQKAQ